MINPVQCLSQIMNNPELAVPVFDLLVWFQNPKAVDSPEYDEMLEMAFAKTPYAQDQRQVYSKVRAA